MTSHYELRNAADFAEYIASHPQLTDFLQASHQELRRLFGPEPRFVLDVVRDPEASTPSDFLFVNIRTSMPVDEAMARLDQFDDSWYLDQVDLFGELVNFNLEFYERRVGGLPGTGENLTIKSAEQTISALASLE